MPTEHPEGPPVVLDNGGPNQHRIVVQVDVGVFLEPGGQPALGGPEADDVVVGSSVVPSALLVSSGNSPPTKADSKAAIKDLFAPRRTLEPGNGDELTALTTKLREQPGREVSEEQVRSALTEHSLFRKRPAKATHIEAPSPRPQPPPPPRPSRRELTEDDPERAIADDVIIPRPEPPPNRETAPAAMHWLMPALGGAIVSLLVCILVIAIVLSRPAASQSQTARYALSGTLETPYGENPLVHTDGQFFAFITWLAENHSEFKLGGQEHVDPSWVSEWLQHRSESGKELKSFRPSETEAGKVRVTLLKKAGVDLSGSSGLQFAERARISQQMWDHASIVFGSELDKKWRESPTFRR